MKSSAFQNQRTRYKKIFNFTSTLTRILNEKKCERARDLTWRNIADSTFISLIDIDRKQWHLMEFCSHCIPSIMNRALARSWTRLFTRRANTLRWRSIRIAIRAKSGRNSCVYFCELYVLYAVVWSISPISQRRRALVNAKTARRPLAATMIFRARFCTFLNLWRFTVLTVDTHLNSHDNNNTSINTTYNSASFYTKVQAQTIATRCSVCIE